MLFSRLSSILFKTVFGSSQLFWHQS